MLVGHVPLNQESRGLPHPTFGALSYRAAPAVSFFFTLSGFLITYLLLQETRRRGSVDVPAFYLRRALRIWPLYFLVVGFGLAFYNAVLPALGIAYPVSYPLGLAAFLYVFFLPNLMNSLYTVGGILNPSWSIGVEEQFYLAWAPLVKRWHARLPLACAIVFAVSMGVYASNRLGAFGRGWPERFVTQLQFHYMAAGAFAAWLLLEREPALLGSRFFASRPWQWATWLFLFQYLVLGRLPGVPALDEIAQTFLFPWLIVETAVNPRRLFRLEMPLTEWLGGISYGFYMFHMLAVYATTLAFQHLAFWQARPTLYVASYYLLAIGLTTLISYVSFRFYEGPILELKGRFAR